MEEKGYSTTGKNTQTLGICTISKDSFQISTLVCSTKLTQNGNSFYILMNICLFSCASWFFFKLKIMLLWKTYQNVSKHMESYCQLRYYIKKMKAATVTF